MNNNDYKSILKSLNKTINIYRSRRNKWTLLKRNSRLQIQKNFSIHDMANTYMKNWVF